MRPPGQQGQQGQLPSAALPGASALTRHFQKKFDAAQKELADLIALRNQQALTQAQEDRVEELETEVPVHEAAVESSIFMDEKRQSFTAEEERHYQLMAGMFRLMSSNLLMGIVMAIAMICYALKRGGKFKDQSKLVKKARKILDGLEGDGVTADTKLQEIEDHLDGSDASLAAADTQLSAPPPLDLGYALDAMHEASEHQVVLEEQIQSLKNQLTEAREALDMVGSGSQATLSMFSRQLRKIGVIQAKLAKLEASYKKQTAHLKSLLSTHPAAFSQDIKQRLRALPGAIAAAEADVQRARRNLAAAKTVLRRVAQSNAGANNNGQLRAERAVRTAQADLNRAYDTLVPLEKQKKAYDRLAKLTKQSLKHAVKNEATKVDVAAAEAAKQLAATKTAQAVTPQPDLAAAATAAGAALTAAQRAKTAADACKLAADVSPNVRDKSTCDVAIKKSHKAAVDAAEATVIVATMTAIATPPIATPLTTPAAANTAIATIKAHMLTVDKLAQDFDTIKNLYSVPPGGTDPLSAANRAAMNSSEAQVKQAVAQAKAQLRAPYMALAQLHAVEADAAAAKATATTLVAAQANLVAAQATLQTAQAAALISAAALAAGGAAPTAAVVQKDADDRAAVVAAQAVHQAAQLAAQPTVVARTQADEQIKAVNASLLAAQAYKNAAEADPTQAAAAVTAAGNSAAIAHTQADAIAVTAQPGAPATDITAVMKANALAESAQAQQAHAEALVAADDMPAALLAGGVAVVNVRAIGQLGAAAQTPAIRAVQAVIDIAAAINASATATAADKVAANQLVVDAQTCNAAIQAGGPNAAAANLAVAQAHLARAELARDQVIAYAQTGLAANQQAVVGEIAAAAAARGAIDQGNYPQLRAKASLALAQAQAAAAEFYQKTGQYGAANAAADAARTACLDVGDPTGVANGNFPQAAQIQNPQLYAKALVALAQARSSEAAVPAASVAQAYTAAGLANGVAGQQVIFDDPAFAEQKAKVNIAAAEACSAEAVKRNAVGGTLREETDAHKIAAQSYGNAAGAYGVLADQARQAGNMPKAKQMAQLAHDQAHHAGVSAGAALAVGANNGQPTDDNPDNKAAACIAAAQAFDASAGAQNVANEPFHRADDQRRVARAQAAAAHWHMVHARAQAMAAGAAVAVPQAATDAAQAAHTAAQQIDQTDYPTKAVKAFSSAAYAYAEIGNAALAQQCADQVIQIKQQMAIQPRDYVTQREMAQTVSNAYGDAAIAWQRSGDDVGCIRASLVQIKAIKDLVEISSDAAGDAQAQNDAPAAGRYAAAATGFRHELQNALPAIQRVGGDNDYLKQKASAYACLANACGYESSAWQVIGDQQAVATAEEGATAAALSAINCYKRLVDVNKAAVDAAAPGLQKVRAIDELRNVARHIGDFANTIQASALNINSAGHPIQRAGALLNAAKAHLNHVKAQAVVEQCVTAAEKAEAKRQMQDSIAAAQESADAIAAIAPCTDALRVKHAQALTIVAQARQAYVGTKNRRRAIQAVPQVEATVTAIGQHVTTGGNNLANHADFLVAQAQAKSACAQILRTAGRYNDAENAIAFAANIVEGIYDQRLVPQGELNAGNADEGRACELRTRIQAAADAVQQAADHFQASNHAGQDRKARAWSGAARAHCYSAEVHAVSGNYNGGGVANATAAQAAASLAAAAANKIPRGVAVLVRGKARAHNNAALAYRAEARVQHVAGGDVAAAHVNAAAQFSHAAQHFVLAGASDDAAEAYGIAAQEFLNAGGHEADAAQAYFSQGVQLRLNDDHVDAGVAFNSAAQQYNAAGNVVQEANARAHQALELADAAADAVNSAQAFLHAQAAVRAAVAVVPNGNAAALTMAADAVQRAANTVDGLGHPVTDVGKAAAHRAAAAAHRAAGSRPAETASNARALFYDNRGNAQQAIDAATAAIAAAQAAPQDQGLADAAVNVANFASQAAVAARVALGQPPAGGANQAQTAAQQQVDLANLQVQVASVQQSSIAAIQVAPPIAVADAADQNAQAGSMAKALADANDAIAATNRALHAAAQIARDQIVAAQAVQVRVYNAQTDLAHALAHEGIPAVLVPGQGFARALQDATAARGAAPNGSALHAAAQNIVTQAQAAQAVQAGIAAAQAQVTAARTQFNAPQPDLAAALQAATDAATATQAQVDAANGLNPAAPGLVAAATAAHQAANDLVAAIRLAPQQAQAGAGNGHPPPPPPQGGAGQGNNRAPGQPGFPAQGDENDDADVVDDVDDEEEEDAEQQQQQVPAADDHDGADEEEAAQAQRDYRPPAGSDSDDDSDYTDDDDDDDDDVYEDMPGFVEVVGDDDGNEQSFDENFNEGLKQMRLQNYHSANSAFNKALGYCGDQEELKAKCLAQVAKACAATAALRPHTEDSRDKALDALGAVIAVGEIKHGADSGDLKFAAEAAKNSADQLKSMGAPLVSRKQIIGAYRVTAGAYAALAEMSVGVHKIRAQRSEREAHNHVAELQPNPVHAAAGRAGNQRLFAGGQPRGLQPPAGQEQDLRRYSRSIGVLEGTVTALSNKVHADGYIAEQMDKDHCRNLQGSLEGYEGRLTGLNLLDDVTVEPVRERLNTLREQVEKIARTLAIGPLPAARGGRRQVRGEDANVARGHAPKKR